MVRPHIANGHGQAGFTLLELMVALVVLGFLMVGLTEGSRFGFRAWKHQSDMIADHDQMDAIDRTLRQLLTQVQMRPATEPGELAFTGTLPAAVALGTRRADMSLLVDKDHQLVLQWTPHRHEIPFSGPPLPTTTILLRDVGRMDVGYWHGGDPSNAGDQSGWNDQANANETPKLIKLTIQFPPGDRRNWPPIVISPAAMGPETQDPTAATQ
jgi:general secretion pathway protein J